MNLGGDRRILEEWWFGSEKEYSVRPDKDK